MADMPFLDSDLVRPLQFAANRFLEVLVSRFDLSCRGKGADLEIAFDGHTPATWTRTGRDQARSRIPDFERTAAGYQKQLDALLLTGNHGSLHFDDPAFVFRWVSAGALPILRIGECEYYCLFYREIFPIGWNIANGASDNIEELMDPLRVLERELGEELLILDWRNRQRYQFKGISGRLSEMGATHRVLREWLRSDSAEFQDLGAPLKWVEGPDTISVSNGDEVRKLSGWFLNMNALDFGIELDRVVKLNVGEDVIVCDGEVVEGRLLNRVVGLFKVQDLDKQLADGTTEYIPDRFYYRGKLYPGAKLKTLTARRFLHDISWQGEKVTEAYKGAALKYDLCPVTRRIVSRYVGSLSEQRVLGTQVEAFISFGAGDEHLAERVFQIVAKRFDGRVFFSPESRRERTWDRAIDAALDSATCLIAVGSQVDRLSGPVPEYEYRVFHKDIRTGRKLRGKLITFVSGINPVELPLPLRYYDIEVCSDQDHVAEALDQLAVRLSG
jgi:hypothetical protein